MELLRGIHKRLDKWQSEKINNLFEGQLENHLRLIINGVDRVCCESFMDISLNIEGCGSIQEALTKFTERELLSDDNCINTDEYGPQAAHKYHIFKKLPPFLWVNLKRYRYDCNTGGFQKINDRFKFGETLDFSPWMDEGVEPHPYKLLGVLVHRGEIIHNGHYYCFIKPLGEGWLRFDDRTVTRASLQQVFEDSFGGTHITGAYDWDMGRVVTQTQPSPETAYMLVYVQENQYKQMLRPVSEDEIPNWIRGREAILNRKIEQKNFIQVLSPLI